MENLEKNKKPLAGSKDFKIPVSKLYRDIRKKLTMVCSKDINRLFTNMLAYLFEDYFRNEENDKPLTDFKLQKHST